MSDQYYCRYSGDYLRDTGDLTLLEHGAYSVLLDHYYMQESMPADNERLYRICRAFSKEEQAAVDFVVGRYFVRDGEFLINKRAEEEISKRKKFIEKMSTRGKAGAAAKWGKDAYANAQAMAQAEEQAMLKQCLDDDIPSPSPSPSLSPTPSPDDDPCPPADDAVPEIPHKEILDYLNEKTGKHFKQSSKATRAKINARFIEGYRLDDFKMVIDNKVSKWLNDPNMADYLRPETLFGTKFESYLNERGHPLAGKVSSVTAKNIQTFNEWVPPE